MRNWIGERLIRLGLWLRGHDWKQVVAYKDARWETPEDAGRWAAAAYHALKAAGVPLPPLALLPNRRAVMAAWDEQARLKKETRAIAAEAERQVAETAEQTPVELPPMGGPFGLCTCDTCRDMRAGQPACCCSAHLPPILSIKISPAEVQAVQDYLDSTPLPLGRPVALRDGFAVERIDPPEFSFRYPDGRRAALRVFEDGSWEVRGEGDPESSPFRIRDIPLDEIVTAHARGCLRVLPQDDDTGEYPAVPGDGAAADAAGNPLR